MLSKIGLEKQLEQYKTRHFVKRGSYIYTEGECGNFFYYIVKGEVVITTPTTRGNERLINLATSGQFLGIQCIHSKKYLTNAQAVRDTILYRFISDEMNRLLNENVYVLDLITDTMKHNSEVVLQSLFLSTMPALDRILFVINIFLNNSSENKIYVTPTQIAKYTSLTRVRVHQILKELEEQNIITCDKGIITVHDYSSIVDSHQIKLN